MRLMLMIHLDFVEEGRSVYLSIEPQVLMAEKLLMLLR